MLSMNEEKMGNKIKSFFKKIGPLVFPTIYCGLVIALAITIFYSFGKRSYLSIYIDGPSMQPTLNNNAVKEEVYDSNTGVLKRLTKNTEFGYADKSNIAKDNIKHFDIVVTYFSNDYSNGQLHQSADYKIKRIIALPGETFKIENGIISYKDNNGTWYTPEMPYTPNGTTYVDDKVIYPTAKDKAETTLEENQYWVLGDNWKNSSDSQVNGPIKKEYIAGVLVAIEGTCTVVNQNGKNTFEDYNFYKKPIYYI